MVDKMKLNSREKCLLGKIRKNGLPSKKYSHNTAWLMAYLSELVYQDFENLTDGFLQGIFTDYNISVYKTYDSGKNKNHDTQALLIETDNYLVLVFRGTETDRFRDFLSIINIVPSEVNECKSKDNEGKLHSGFDGAYKAVAEEIQEDIAKFPDLPLLVTGHSLGGALAAIAAKRLKNKDENRTITCYTFGAPKIGDQNWVNRFPTPKPDINPESVPVYRVLNARDVIPFLPPSKVVWYAAGILAFLFLIAPFLSTVAPHAFLGFWASVKMLCASWGLSKLLVSIVWILVAIIILLSVAFAGFAMAWFCKMARMFSIYRHIGKICYITKPNQNKKVAMKNAEPWWKKMRLTALLISLLGRGFEEHKICRYRKRMAFLAEKDS